MRPLCACVCLGKHKRCCISATSMKHNGIFKEHSRAHSFEVGYFRMPCSKTAAATAAKCNIYVHAVTVLPQVLPELRRRRLSYYWLIFFCTPHNVSSLSLAQHYTISQKHVRKLCAYARNRSSIARRHANNALCRCFFALVEYVCVRFAFAQQSNSSEAAIHAYKTANTTETINAATAAAAAAAAEMQMRAS